MVQGNGLGLPWKGEEGFRKEVALGGGLSQMGFPSQEEGIVHSKAGRSESVI